MAILEVEHLEKRFGGTPVLQDVSFSLEQGQTLAILGSSGSGKTTLLRCLNALEQPDAGCIRVAGETLFDGGVRTAQRGGRLPFGLVFQAFHLFPQYTKTSRWPAACRQSAARTTARTAARSCSASTTRRPACSGRSACWPSRTATPASSPAGSSSAWPSHGRWPCSRTCCALTSRRARWTRS